jgi:hypothetical protein
MEMRARMEGSAVAAGQFISEVESFRDAIDDPTIAFADKKDAYDTILRHASQLDPHDAAFWRAGVALKDALCAWLDYRSPAIGH